MKRFWLFIFLLLPINVFARECDAHEQAYYAASLDNINYNLQYDTDKVGFFSLYFEEMPSGYHAEVGDFNRGFTVLNVAYVSADLSGGLYTLNYFYEDCDFPIKTSEIRIPYYKNLCKSDDCKNDPWFDGTYENKTEIDEAGVSENTTPNIWLIVILIVLIAILTIIIVLVFRKRSSKNEQNV